MTNTTSTDKALFMGGPSTAGAVSARESAKNAYDNTARSTRQGLFAEYGQLLERQLQERAALSFSSDIITRRAAEAASSAIVQAGAGGGASVAALLGDIQRQRLVTQQAMLFNQQMRERQAQFEGLGLQQRAYQTMLAAWGQIPSKASILQGNINDIELGLNLGKAFSPGGGADPYSHF